MELLPGDFVFCRDIHGAGKPIDDILAALVVGPCVLFRFYKEYLSMCHSLYSDAFPPEAISDFVEARDVVLGAKELRTLDLPHVTDSGNVVGGTALERTGRKGRARLSSVKGDGGRCYTIGPSVQHEPVYMSPCAASKLEGGDSESSSMRRNILRVSFIVSIAAL